jgi:hypothetical protein
MVASGLLTLGVSASRVYATPSTTYWTPCTIDFQSYKVGHVTYDNYTTLAKKGPTRGGQAFGNDLGLTAGVLPFQKLQMEAGVDWLEPTDYPLFGNAKIGYTEDMFFKGAPALEAGIFNVGTKKGITDQDIAYLTTGRSLPGGLGRLHLSGYIGNAKVLRSSEGGLQNTGFMVGYDYGFWNVKSQGGDYNRLVLAADFSSGKNAVGGGGAGLYYYFSKDVSILSGPVWFNDRTINGDWKWTTQLDINFSPWLSTSK